jgi:hypothetical protein
MLFRSSTIALALLAFAACKPSTPPAADAGPAAPQPIAARPPAAPELPECEKQAAVFTGVVASMGDTTKPVDPLVRGAFNHYQHAFRVPCTPEIDWQVVENNVKLLDDSRVLYDHTASEMKRVLVQDAAVLTLEKMTGTTQGAYSPPKVDAKGDELTKITQANAAVRDAWKKWWATAQGERDKWLGTAKAKVTEEQAALEQSKLAKFMTSTISVLHSWDLQPWTGDQLTPQDVVKKPGFVPEMLQPPVHPSLFEEVKWGWYLKKDGVIYRVLRDEDPSGKEWRLDAFKQEVTKLPGDAKKIVDWPLSDKLPLSKIKPGQQVGIPPAFIDWLRQQPPVYFSALESGTFGATVVEGERIYLIALRGGEIGM